MRFTIAPKLVSIETIERLEKTTLNDQLKRFFMARSFFKAMRFDQDMVGHHITLRGIREWFDASCWLATRSNSPYRLDPSLQQYVDEYFEKAKTDKGLSNRLTKYLPRAYVDKMLEQVRAAPYQLTARVAKLRESGDIAAASVLNDQLLDALKAEE